MKKTAIILAILTVFAVPAIAVPASAADATAAITATATATDLTPAIAADNKLKTLLKGKYYYARSGKEHSINFGDNNTFTLAYGDPAKEYKGTYTITAVHSTGSYSIVCKSGDFEADISYTISTGELVLGSVDTAETTGVINAPLSKNHINLTVLPAPALVKADTVSSTRINLSWSKVAGAEKYEVYMKDVFYGGAFKLLTTTTLTNYTAKNLNGKYQFAVVPVDVTDGKTALGNWAFAVGVTGGKSPKTVTKYQDDKVEEKTVNTYDAYGNVLTAARYDADGKLTSKEVHTYYDTNGTPLTVTEYNADGVCDGKSVLGYDSEGNQISTEWYKDDGKTLQNKTESTFDRAGNKISYTWYDGGGNVVSKDFYSYDANGNKLTETNYDEKGTIVGSFTYTYDTKGNMLTATAYGADGKVTGGSTSTYDKAGNMIAYVSEINTYYRFTTTYDSDGNRLTDTHYKKDGSVKGKGVYTHDKNGNLLTAVGNLGGGSDGTDSTSVCTYDEKGNILTYISTGSDGEYKTVYEY